MKSKPFNAKSQKIRMIQGDIWAASRENGPHARRILAIFSFKLVCPLQACKLALVTGHLCGKFYGFDWRMPSLTGHVHWALQLWREYKIYFPLIKKDKREGGLLI